MLTGKFEGSLAVCALALGANACGAESLDSEVLESTATDTGRMVNGAIYYGTTCSVGVNGNCSGVVNIRA
jgi:hypothetical protein